MTPDLSRYPSVPNRDAQVIFQQGRVQLDTELNALGAIPDARIRQLIADLTGPLGAGPPGTDCGFLITTIDADKTTIRDLKFSKGRYFVGGIVCDNDREDGFYLRQEDFTPTNKPELPTPPLLVYLEAWTQEVTALEDPSLIEVALGGLETAARSRVVWRVRVAPLDLKLASTLTPEQKRKAARDFLRTSPVLPPAPPTPSTPVAAPNLHFWDGTEVSRPMLMARATRPADDDTTRHCYLPADARYRGLENQLYRVEIHSGGTIPPAVSGAGKEAKAFPPSFKWSRENGSVAFRVEAFSESPGPAGAAQADGPRLWSATLADLGRDPRRTLDVDDWVEVVDAASLRRDPAGDWIAPGATPEAGASLGRDLLRVRRIDPITRLVTLEQPQSKDKLANLRPDYLRRWDQRDLRRPAPAPGDPAAVLASGTIAVRLDEWIPLEDGVEVRFVGSSFAPGDFWTIPARTLTQDVIWPTGADNQPKPVEPQNAPHAYAPLAYVEGPQAVTDLRSRLRPPIEDVPE